MPPSDLFWQQKLAALCAHVAAHGRLPPKGDASGLSGWVNNQRQGKKAADEGRRSKYGTMTPARVAALEAVPGWAWEVDLEALWQEKLAALRAYVGAHGRLPPQCDASGLGTWINTQRQAKKAADAGRKSNTKMTPEHAAALEGVPGWAWEVDAEAAWEEKLNALRAYVGAHGRLPLRDDPSGLGVWVRTQLHAKRAGPRCEHKMTPARAAALEAVPGWAWEVDLDALWQEKLAALGAYVGAHGRLPSHRDAAGLGKWISVQRRAKKWMDAGRLVGKQMTPQRAAALEAVPGWAWDARRRAAAPAAPPAKRAKRAGQ